MMSVRYPPYAGKFARYKLIANSKPNFDRQGRVRLSWIQWLLTLGGLTSTKGAFAVYLIVTGGKLTSFSNLLVLGCLVEANVCTPSSRGRS